MEKANWTFEEQWHQALDKAEVAPPPQVWVAIDGQLANEQAGEYKRIAVFYKWLAAACLLLFTVSAVLYWQAGQYSENQITSFSEASDQSGVDSNGNGTANDIQTMAIKVEEDEEVMDQQMSHKAPHSEVEYASVEQSQSDNQLVLSSPSNRSTLAERDASAMEVNSTLVSAYTPLTELPHLTGLNAKKLAFPSVVEPWTSDHLYGVANTWHLIEKDKLISPLWAGVSFSTGSFDPGFGNDSGGGLAFASQDNVFLESATVQNRSQAPSTFEAGQSIAGGLDVGKRISSRVMISGGLHYSAFNTGSVSSQLATDDASNTFALTGETNDSNLNEALNQGALRYSGGEVQIFNEYQYLTIPIKAGYVLLDKKFNITMNTGISSNIRVDSRLVSSGESEALSNDFSTSAAYQSIYFNFLTSVTFGYLFKNHYQFLIEPNYNQALNDFTSSSNPNQARPRNVGVSIGFRYNF